MLKLEKIIVTIEKLIFEGKALTRLPDGRVCFVIGNCLPGESVELRITKNKKDYAEGVVLRRLSDSGVRQKSPCPYFGECGGCFLQSLSYADQLSVKQSFVQEAVDGILKRSSIALLPIVGSDDVFSYRHKVELTFFSKDDGSFDLGFCKKGTWFNSVDINHCLLFDSRLANIIEVVRLWALRYSLSAFHHKRFRGLLKNLVVRRSVIYDEWMIGVVTSDEEFDSNLLNELRLSFAECVPLKSFYRRVIKIKRSKGETYSDVLVWGSEFISERLCGLDYRIRFADFFQNNVSQAEKMVSYAVDHLSVEPGDRVLDLYCGVGTFTLPIAKKYDVKITGVEIVQSAIDSAVLNACENGIDGIEFIREDVSKIIDKLLLPDKYDRVLVDPPRSGLGAVVVQGLLRAMPKRIIYVSCNPATMARDLLGFGLEYSIVSIKPFDLFPQTYHVECVVVLDRKDM